MPTRRRVLAALGVAVGTAGCSQGTTREADQPTTTDAETIQLSEVQLQNDHDTAHEVQLAVENGDQMVHLATYTLEENNSTQIDGEWMDSTGAYQVHARLDEETIQTIRLAGDPSGCTRILIRVGTAGELSIWNGSCSAATDTSDN